MKPTATFLQSPRRNIEAQDGVTLPAQRPASAPPITGPLDTYFTPAAQNALPAMDQATARAELCKLMGCVGEPLPRPAVWPPDTAKMPAYMQRLAKASNEVMAMPDAHEGWRRFKDER